MINKKTFFCLIISLIALGNAEVNAMHMTPPKPTPKTTSFSIFRQLLAIFFIKNEKKLGEKIQEINLEIIEEIACIKVPFENRVMVGELRKTKAILKNINCLWDQLSSFYVSNTFEQIFNRYGLRIDDQVETAEIPTIGKISRLLKLSIHSDKQKIDNPQISASDLITIFTVKKRVNPFMSRDVLNNANKIIKEATPDILEIMKIKKSTLLTEAGLELQKAEFNLKCTIFAQEYEISRLQKRKGH